MSDSTKKSGSEIIHQVITDVGADVLAKVAEGATEEQVAAAMVVSAIKSGVKNAGRLTFDLAFRSPADRRLEAMRLELDSQLGAIGEELAEKVQELVDDAEVDTEGDLITNLSGMFADWQDLYATARTSHMRRLILAVLVNSLDKEAYESGVRRRVYRVLRDLDYAEVRFLAQGIAHPSGVAIDFFGGCDVRGVAARIMAEPDGRSLSYEEATAKAREFLEFEVHDEHLRDGGEYALYARQLVRCGLVLDHDSYTQIRRTWLGNQVIRLCADTESLGKTFREHGAADDGVPLE